MPTSDIQKLKKKGNNLYLRVAKGHFATSHVHSNYYIDVAKQKSSLTEAKAVAEDIATYYKYTASVIDTILCLDGMEVVGACLASKLMRDNVVNTNAKNTIYVVTPESTNASQLIFRDNIVPMIENKHVLILAVSVSSGYTAKMAIDAVNYYGGSVAGVSSIFATTDNISGVHVKSVFDPKDIPDYSTYPSHDCPLCKAGNKVDALVNYHGFSKL